MKNKAVFLDRDGTLNKDTGYLCNYKDWRWLTGVREGLSALSQAGYLLVIVSNQSGIARGFYREEDWWRVSERINQDLASYGIRIDAFYFCPHHPDFTGECECRKPRPGMIFRSARELDIDLNQSWLIGDKDTDIQAALAAGCQPIYLDYSGEGDTIYTLDGDIHICGDFACAVKVILNYEEHPS